MISCGRPQFHGLETTLNSVNCESSHLEEAVPGETANRSNSGAIP